MGKISIDKTSNTIHFGRRLNEEVEYPIVNIPKNSWLTLDFGKIEHINSIGIMNFTKFIKSLGDDVRIELVNCRPTIIKTLNIVFNFIGPNASVESFYFPYLCNNCDKEFHILMHNKKDYTYKGVLPKLDGLQKCPECKGPAEEKIKLSEFCLFLQKESD